MLAERLVQLGAQDWENPVQHREKPAHQQVRLQTAFDVDGPLTIEIPRVMLLTALWVVEMSVWVVLEPVQASRQPIGSQRGVMASNQLQAARHRHWTDHQQTHFQRYIQRDIWQ